MIIEKRSILFNKVLFHNLLKRQLFFRVKECCYIRVWPQFKSTTNVNLILVDVSVTCPFWCCLNYHYITITFVLLISWLHFWTLSYIFALFFQVRAKLWRTSPTCWVSTWLTSWTRPNAMSTLTPSATPRRESATRASGWTTCHTPISARYISNYRPFLAVSPVIG